MEYAFKREFVKRDAGAIATLAITADVTNVTVDGRALPARSIEYLLNFAFQSLQDAYAGAKGLEEARGLFAKKLDALVAGTIGVRGSGASPVSDSERAITHVVREVMKRNMTAEAWKEFNEASPEAQRDRIATVYAKNEAKLAPLAQAKLEELERERARKAALTVTVEL